MTMIRVDENICAGCGRCEKICPEGFSMQDGIAKVRNGEAPCVELVISECPPGAVLQDLS
jgi:ferredoxin